MIKGSFNQEDLTSVNIHTPNLGLPIYIKQILTYLKAYSDIPHFQQWVGHPNNQYGSIGLELHFRPNRPSRHIQNIPSNSSRIDILLKCTQNILQNRSYVRPQKKY